MAQPKAEAAIMALAEYVRGKRLDEKRAVCPVCRLGAEVRKELAIAGQRGYTRKEQVGWLREVVGVEITALELQAHFAGRHDD